MGLAIAMMLAHIPTVCWLIYDHYKTKKEERTKH